MPTPTRVIPIEGKGLGVLATRDIAPGEAIMADRPLLQRTKDFKTGALSTTVEGDVQDARRKLLALAKESRGRNDIERVINANSFVFVYPPREFPVDRAIPDELSGAKEQQTVVFANISRINHSCSANATFTWHKQDEVGVIRASRPIKANEEITINYGVSGSRKERQASLRHCFNFHCRCERCCAEELKTSKRASEPASAQANAAPWSNAEVRAKAKEARWAELERWLAHKCLTASSSSPAVGPGGPDRLARPSTASSFYSRHRIPTVQQTGEWSGARQREIRSTSKGFVGMYM